MYIARPMQSDEPSREAIEILKRLEVHLQHVRLSLFELVELMKRMAGQPMR